MSGALPPRAAAMSWAEFTALRDYIHRRTGIYFADDQQARLEHRLAERVAATASRSFTDYFFRLQRGELAESELDVVIELITTHETYFFRERSQLDAFALEILPELKVRLAAERRLRIWSAGCSTGEEVYTIAMLILEHGGFHDWNVEVFGSDISRKVIARARQAVYGTNSFRSCDPRMQQRYFESQEGKLRVRDEVRRRTAFGTINLVEPGSLALVAPVDVIFCRNVLIYFHADAKRTLAETFFRKLRPAGYLLLGHAETLLNISTQFEVVSLKNDLVYRHPERAWLNP